MVDSSISEIGNVAGIVALAGLVVKEAFGFVIRPRSGQPVEIDWGRVAQMMHASVAPLEQKIEVNNRLIESKLELDREHNTMFRDYLQRMKGRDEGRDEGRAEGLAEGRAEADRERRRTRREGN